MYIYIYCVCVRLGYKKSYVREVVRSASFAMVAKDVTKGTTTDDIGAGVEGAQRMKVCS